jgi:hypothetical protein
MMRKSWQALMRNNHEQTLMCIPNIDMYSRPFGTPIGSILKQHRPHFKSISSVENLSYQ